MQAVLTIFNDDGKPQVISTSANITRDDEKKLGERFQTACESVTAFQWDSSSGKKEWIAPGLLQSCKLSFV